MFNLLRFFLSTAACVAPGAGLAQQDPACALGVEERWVEMSEQMEGSWTIEHLSGFVKSGAMVIPYPGDGAVERVSIISHPDGVLEIDHPEAQEPVMAFWADEPRWVFEGRPDMPGMAAVPDPVLTDTDVELLMGCPNDQMARLLGTSTAVVNGVEMTFNYRLLIPGVDSMFGIMHVNGTASGHEFNSWRSVTLNR
ncbi:hypothetical protein [Aliiroseovarius subalbicans]|uniref:hypothetical protein n=1 Tax=Aliiroseovarius subalbicans TaxID=2925840 RepID=UPI001F565A84|nr:hypothetical protein [Aliiroseovarius subalbicans]MCI2400596.1 hypothetical protein [Aliiroseovarius subalbicans]